MSWRVACMHAPVDSRYRRPDRGSVIAGRHPRPLIRYSSHDDSHSAREARPPHRSRRARSIAWITSQYYVFYEAARRCFYAARPRPAVRNADDTSTSTTQMASVLLATFQNGHVCFSMQKIVHAGPRCFSDVAALLVTTSAPPAQAAHVHRPVPIEPLEVRARGYRGSRRFVASSSRAVRVDPRRLVARASVCTSSMSGVVHGRHVHP